MIETYAKAEVRNFSDQDGTRLWSYAHMNIVIPWYFVRYEVEVEEHVVTSQFLLFDCRQIEQLIDNKSIKIKAIYLVSPEHVNHTQDWSMDPIKSLSTGIDENDTSRTYIRYELMDSTCYYYPSPEVEIMFRKKSDIYIAS